jgi:hypothetical protein
MAICAEVSAQKNNLGTGDGQLCGEGWPLAEAAIWSVLIQQF